MVQKNAVVCAMRSATVPAAWRFHSSLAHMSFRKVRLSGAFNDVFIHMALAWYIYQKKNGHHIYIYIWYTHDTQIYGLYILVKSNLRAATVWLNTTWPPSTGLENLKLPSLERGFEADCDGGLFEVFRKPYRGDLSEIEGNRYISFP